MLKLAKIPSFAALITSVFLFGGLATSQLSYAQGSNALTANDKKEILSSVRDVMEHKAYVPNVDFSKWDSFISKEQPEIKAAKNDEDFALAVQGALSNFGISHAYILTPQAVSQRNDHSVTGIGVQIFPEKNDVLIVKVYPGSSAAMGGLLPGDKIVSVENSTSDMVTRIRGKEGTTVKLRVLHPDGKTVTYSLVRHAFNIADPATITFPDKDTSVVTIPTFDLTYDANTVNDLMTQAASRPNLVVDLRSNPGGSVLSMLHFLDLLIKPSDVIGTMVGPENVKDYQKTHPGFVDVTKVAATVSYDNKLKATKLAIPYYKGNIVVLVNQASGSAAEIAAAALRDDRGATIVGEKSAGAVLVSVIGQVADGFMLQFPIFDYVTESGIRLEGHGVTPDVVVPDQKIPDQGPDAQLLKAIATVEAKNKIDTSADRQANGFRPNLDLFELF